MGGTASICARCGQHWSKHAGDGGPLGDCAGFVKQGSPEPPAAPGPAPAATPEPPAATPEAAEDNETSALT